MGLDGGEKKLVFDKFRFFLFLRPLIIQIEYHYGNRVLKRGQRSLKCESDGLY